MSDYLEQARTWYKDAVNDFRAGSRKEDDPLLRSAADKAWNAVVQATYALLEKFELPAPSTERERRQGLLEIEREDRDIRRKAFRDRYMAREQSLHEWCFYQGLYDVELLREDFRKVRRYVDDVERIVQEE